MQGKRLQISIRVCLRMSFIHPIFNDPKTLQLELIFNGHIHPYLNMAELQIFSRVSYVVSIWQEYNIEAKKKWELAKKNHEDNPVVRDGCDDRGDEGALMKRHTPIKNDGLRSSFRGV